MGTLIVGTIGAVIGWGVKKLTESTFSALVCTGLFMAAMTLLPFSIEMPQSMYQALLSSNIAKVFATVGYLIPIRDILTCTCFILICRYAGTLWGLVVKIFNWITKTVGGGQ